MRLLKWLKTHWREVTWHGVINFIEAKLRQFMGGGWKERQVLWRMNQVARESPLCLEGACVKCGCDTPDKFWETDACSEGCYPTWKPEEEWLMFEKTENDKKRKPTNDKDDNL